MKRLLFAATLLLLSVSGYAQLVQSSSLIVTKNHRRLSPVKRGFYSDVRLGGMYGDYQEQMTFEVTYAGGYRFGNTLYLGAGVGVNYNTWWEGLDLYTYDHGSDDYCYYGIPPAEITVPIFAQIRVYFLKTRLSPFVDATSGIMLTTNGEVAYGEYCNETAKFGRCMGYGTLSIGVNCRMTDKSSVYLLVGGRLYGTRVMQTDTGQEFDPYSSDLPSSLHIGTRPFVGYYASVGFTF